MQPNHNNPKQHRLLRNRGPLYAPQLLWYRFALFTTKTAPLRSAAVDGRYAIRGADVIYF